MSNPKLNPKEESSAKKTRSPPKRAKVEQSVPKKKKLKTDAEKAAEKAQHLRFGKAELTPDELSRLSKAQKREMYAAHAAGLRYTGRLTSTKMTMWAHRL